MQIEFEFDKVTKNKVRFTETGSDFECDEAIGKLYVHKDALSELGVEEDDWQDITVLVDIDVD